MIEETINFIQNVDNSNPTISDALASLRTMVLDEFGELLLNIPDSRFPNLSNLLPRSTPDEVQEQWTGSSGVTLLKQSTAFINFAVTNFQDITSRQISAAKVLDFGCGWGRLLRLMMFFTDPQNLYGCDPWEASLAHVRRTGLPATLAKSEVRPENLPFKGIKFDLIYAFSIFTHLPEDIALQCLSAMRKSINEDGLLIFTVRPASIWHDRKHPLADEMKKRHYNEGFVFECNLNNSDYGISSISREYIRKLPSWRLERIGLSMSDSQQVLVCLRPA